MKKVVFVCIIMFLVIFIFGTFSLINKENVREDKISELMIKKDIVTFTKVGEIKPNDTKIIHWYKPIIIYEGKTKDKDIVYLAFDQETDKLSILSSE